MLKTLEEPPGHVKFVLATTDPQKIPVTVLSRCLQFNLKQIPPQQIRAQLEKILGQESVAFEAEALTLLARAAHGSLRDGLSLLDQAIAHGGGRVDQSSVRAMLGSVDQEYLRDILSALQRRDGPSLIAVADRMAERSLSFEIALQELAVLLHRVALAQNVPQAVAAEDPDRPLLEDMAASFSPEEVQLLYQIVLHGREDIGLAPDEYAGFTMTLMRMLAFAPAMQPAQAAAAPEPARRAAPAAPATRAAPGARLAPASESAQAPATPAPAVRGEPAAPAPVPPEARSAAAADLKKKDIDGDWNTFVNGLPLAGMERMLAHNCELVAWQNGRIELRVPYAQRHLNGKAYQDRLKAALEHNLGAKVKLEISVGPSNGTTIAEIRERENEQRQNEAVAAIERDPFVKDLIENLDARVVSSSIKPVQ